MITFNNKDELQIVKTNINEIIDWSKQHLKKLLGYDVTLFCKGENLQYLYYNVDETVMTNKQFDVYGKYFTRNKVGSAESDFIKLLTYVFGEARYYLKFYDLDGAYIIRDITKDNN